MIKCHVQGEYTPVVSPHGSFTPMTESLRGPPTVGPDPQMLNWLDLTLIG